MKLFWPFTCSLVLGASTARVARLVTHVTSMVIDACLAEFAVTDKLVKFLAKVVDALRCCSFARRADGCEAPTATLGCL